MNKSIVKASFQSIGIIGLLKTVWFNYRYLPLKVAVKLPFLLSSKVRIFSCHREAIKIVGPIRPFMITLGGSIATCYNIPSFYSIDGQWIISSAGGRTSIGVGSIIRIMKNGILELGSHALMCQQTTIVCYNHIKIGNDNLWSHQITVRDNDGHQILDKEGKITNPNKPVEIGNHVFITAGCIVLKGSLIPDNSIIGAKSVVLNNLSRLSSEDRAVFAGQPAKLIKSGYSWIHDGVPNDLPQ